MDIKINPRGKGELDKFKNFIKYNIILAYTEDTDYNLCVTTFLIRL